MGNDFGGLSNSLKYYEFSLDSLDASQPANSSSSPTDWPLFQIGGRKPLENVAAIKILEVQIPYTWYTFNSSNNTFLYRDTFLLTPTLVSLPIGNYTAVQIATNLETALNTVSTFNFTVVYNTNLQKFSIYNNNVNSTYFFSLYFGDVNDMVGNTNPGLLLGFNPGENRSSQYLASGTPFGVYLPAPNAMSVTGPNYLYVNSSRIGSLCDIYLPKGAMNIGGGNAGPQVAKVPINVQPGGVIFWADPDPSKYFDLENLTSLNELDFFLTLGNTSSQTPLQLNGQPFSIKMGILLNEFSHNDYGGGGQHNERVRTRVSKR